MALTERGECAAILGSIWGRGVQAAKVWAPDSKILRDISSFYGPDLGNAVIEAAKDVFCPEFKR